MPYNGKVISVLFTILVSLFAIISISQANDYYCTSNEVYFLNENELELTNGQEHKELTHPSVNVQLFPILDNNTLAFEIVNDYYCASDEVYLIEEPELIDYQEHREVVRPSVNVQLFPILNNHNLALEIITETHGFDPDRGELKLVLDNSPPISIDLEEKNHEGNLVGFLEINLEEIEIHERILTGHVEIAVCTETESGYLNASNTVQFTLALLEDNDAELRIGLDNKIALFVPRGFGPILIENNNDTYTRIKRDDTQWLSINGICRISGDIENIMHLEYGYDIETIGEIIHDQSLQLVKWDEELDNWQPLDFEIDIENRIIFADIYEPGIYTVLVQLITPSEWYERQGISLEEGWQTLALGNATSEEVAE